MNKINAKGEQEKFQKAVPLGVAEREARSEAEWGWLGGLCPPVLKFLLNI